MISDPTVAKNISKLMLEIDERLNKSVAESAARCPASELIAYRRAVGTVMGDMLLEVMNPIYPMHPDIGPVELE